MFNLYPLAPRNSAASEITYVVSAGALNSSRSSKKTLVVCNALAGVQLICDAGSVAAMPSDLLLFQLPDALPGVPFSKDSGKKATTTASHDPLVNGMSACIKYI